MALETANICDSCSKRLDEGEEIYCDACVEELKTEIAELEDRIEELEKETDFI